MTNIVPVEQDDSAVIPLIETGEQVLGYDPLTPLAGHGPANKMSQPIANTLLYIKRRVGTQGLWDMTGVPGFTVPDPSFNIEMTTAILSDSQYTATPVTGVTTFKVAGSGVIIKPTDARSMRLRASTSGGNFGISAMVLANSNATAADVKTALTNSAPFGTCTHFAALFLDNNGLLGAGNFKLMMRTADPINGNNLQQLFPAGSYVALDQIYLTFNGATGVFSATVGVGAPVAGTNVWDISGTMALRAYVGCYHTANPPVLTDLNYDFDFSDNSGSRVGFQTLNDPTVPVGAADNKSYVVSAPGTYKGRSAVLNDIVMFRDNLQDIQVWPYTYLNAADVDAAVATHLIANPVLSLLQEARMRATVITVTDDMTGQPYTLTRGDVVIVGQTPAGTFAGFTPLHPAVYDGAAWVAYTPADFEGVTLIPNQDPNWYGNALRYDNTYPTMMGAALHGIAVAAYAGVGWRIIVPRTGVRIEGNYALAIGNNVIDLSTQETIIAVAQNAGTYNISFTNFGEGLLYVVANALVTITFGGSSATSVVLSAGSVGLWYVYDGVAMPLYTSSTAMPDPSAHIKMSNNIIATDIISANSAVKVAGVTTATVTDFFTHSGQNRLTYNGYTTKKFEVNASLSVKSGSVNQVFSVQMAKNGALVSNEMRAKTLAANDPSNVALIDLLTLAPGDYVEVWIANNSTTADLIVEYMQLTIGGVK